MAAEQKKFKFSFQINSGDCMACAACELECKDGAIFIDDTVNYAINQDNCKRCGRCQRACPSGAVVKTANA